MNNFKDDYDYLGNSASASDCTGLKYKAPIDSFEDEAYEDVYKFLPPILSNEEKNEI